MEHPVLPAAVRGQCWEHGLLREREGIKASGAGPSSRVKFGWIMRGQVGSSRIKSGSGIEDCMRDLL